MLRQILQSSCRVSGQSAILKGIRNLSSTSVVRALDDSSSSGPKLGSTLFDTTVKKARNNAGFQGFSANPVNQLINKDGIRIVKYILHARFHKNNMHLTFSSVEEDVNYLSKNADKDFNAQVLYYLKLPQKVKLTMTCGAAGYKGYLRGEYESAYQSSSRMFSLIAQKGYLNADIDIIFKGFGKCRQGFQDALMGKEGEKIRPFVTKLSDATPIKFGGVRAPRPRRV